MGPLAGLRIVELAGIGPGPFCGMLLADMGAEVIRVERPGALVPNEVDPQVRSRRSIACDLKKPQAAELVLRLAATADGMFEGFRPGVAERLGIGPDACLEANPRIVYGRITGWGQAGPLADTAGHDLNYVALTGALLPIGEQGGRPVPPLNLVGDYGGGGMLLAFGMVCALLSAAKSGRGQVVDAAMIDGVNAMMSVFHGLRALGLHDDSGPGRSFLGGAAHFYRTYETADGKYVSVAPIEPQFYGEFIDRLGLDRNEFLPGAFRPGAADPSRWPGLAERLAAVFRTKTRDEWCELFAGSDACVAPVLSIGEAIRHEHHRARGAFVDVGGRTQPAPAPRFSATVAAAPKPGVAAGTHTREILAELGYPAAEIGALFDAGVVRQAG